MEAYRRKYMKDKENGESNTNEIDMNREKLIKFYIGSGRYGNSTLGVETKTFDSVSDSEDYSSDEESYDNDSDDEESLFYRDMFTDFAKLTSRGISSFPFIMRDTLSCRGGSYDLGD